MAHDDHDSDEVEVVLTNKTISYIKNEIADLTGKLISITPDPANPSSLSTISALQGHIRGLNNLLEVHEETVNKLNERG